ncbi:universal stress protein [Haloarcula salina]|uniref:universal stress protein n=1 Tax=Haloarcula salina TaxID=1429914 RepID=UPI003C6FB314
MYDDILFPTDGSHGASAAFEHARDIAATYDATLHVLTVVDTSSPHIGMTAEGRDEGATGMIAAEHDAIEPGMVSEEHDIGDAIVERATGLVDEAASAAGDVETVTAVSGGDPHSAILDYAAEHDIDLVVMGTHGRTGIERYLLGSIAEKVVRTSDVPVLTVRAEDED